MVRVSFDLVERSRRLQCWIGHRRAARRLRSTNTTQYSKSRLARSPAEHIPDHTLATRMYPRNDCGTKYVIMSCHAMTRSACRALVRRFPPFRDSMNPDGLWPQNAQDILYVPLYTRLQIFIQLSLTLTKLCHTKRDHPSIFSHFTRT